MKLWLQVINCVLLLVLIGMKWTETKSLEAENVRLRLFNAREVRRYSHPQGKVNERAVALATHLQGIPSSVVGAVYMTENGPPDIETGVLGKTEAIAKHFPFDTWPALEAGRTLNHYAWSWLLNTPEGRVALSKVLAYTAKPYTNESAKDQKQWVKSMLYYEKQIKAYNEKAKP